MVVDSLFMQLKAAVLKGVMGGVDNPKVSAQWIILNNIYP